MATDLPAPDLGAIRARYEAAMTITPADVGVILAAYDAQAVRLAAVEAERDDALVVVRNAQDYLRGKYTLEPLRTLRDAVRAWEAQQADGATGAGQPS